MTDTTKRYRLLKDIDSPELKAKAGDIGKLGAANKVWFDNGRYFFCKDTVESTSRKEWFEVLSEPVKERDFIWNDELVMEYGEWYAKTQGNTPAPLWGKDLFQHFKQSKQSAPEPSALPNKEWKEWKIVDIMDDNGQIISNPSTDIIHMVLKHRGERIHSVRRESDKEIFTIGDKISWGCTGVYETTLTAFEIKNNRLKFYYDKLPENANPCDFLDAINLYKLPTPTQPVEDKPVLFTTEDNQPVYMGETYWKVTILDQCWKSDKTIMREETSKPPSYFKYFSTPEAAEQFCLKNKPSLSLNDVTNFLHKHFMFDTEYYEALKEIVKQKLNHQ